ncbi:MAG: outer membrane beta-barrel protein [Elusimicrobia bacterium]|nr:outer membrane beta-barrel protein [Elusimicrobiota bacterium]
MKKMAFVMMAAISCYPVLCQAFDAGNISYGFGYGFSRPISGEWGKQYKASSALAVSAEYQVDEGHRLGLEIGYDSGHPHFVVTECKPRVLYFAPFYKEVKELGPFDFYGRIGLGLYDRWTPAYTDSRDGAKYSTSFSDKLGYNGGFGLIYKKQSGLTFGIDLRMHKILRFIGIGNAKVSATNIVTTFRLENMF